MRALVTGITGFVGGHLTEHLLDQGDVVVGLSHSGRWTHGAEHLAAQTHIHQFDLVEGAETALAEWITHKQPDVIYHLAAWSNPQTSISDPRGTWRLNLGGSLNLLEAVRRSGLKPRILLISSGVCYGNPAPEWIPVAENCPLRPNNPYAASKAAVDLMGIQHYLAHNADVVIVRPFNHAGPRQSPRYVLASLAYQVALVENGSQESIAVGNLDVIRDFTDVRDVVRGYRLLAQHAKAGEIYNLGTGKGVRLHDALELLRKMARCPVRVRTDPAQVRPVDQPLLIADVTKLRRDTGWTTQYSIEQTLMDMLAWARAAVQAPN